MITASRMRKGKKEDIQIMARLLRTSNGFKILPNQVVKNAISLGQRHSDFQKELKESGFLRNHEKFDDLLVVVRAIDLGSSTSPVGRFVIGRECEGPIILRHFNTDYTFNEYLRNNEGVERHQIKKSKKANADDNNNTDTKDIKDAVNTSLKLSDIKASISSTPSIEEIENTIPPNF
jgi:hypothetical protein